VRRETHAGSGRTISIKAETERTVRLYRAKGGKQRKAGKRRKKAKLNSEEAEIKQNGGRRVGADANRSEVRKEKTRSNRGKKGA